MVSWFTSQAAPSMRAGCSITMHLPPMMTTGYRFGSHAFAPGEYVSISEEDGELHTFKVVSVEAAT